MYSFLHRLGSWLLQKLVVAVLIVVLGLAAYGLWLFAKDTVDADTRRELRMGELAVQREHLQALRADLEQRLADFQHGIEVQQDRLQRAEKVITALRELESWWDRLWGNPAQQKANAEQLAHMEELKTSAAGRMVELKRLILQTAGERDGVGLALDRVQLEIHEVERSKSQAALYLHEAWRQAKWYVVGALAAYFFGPTLMAVFLYYGFAPLISRGRPVRFVERLASLPEVGASHVSVDTALWPGEQLWVKEKFLQTSDEGLARKTRFVLDWRIPLTSVACGLIELVEVSNPQAGNGLNVTLSSANDPHQELAVIEVPEGAALILRPSFLAGVITRMGESLVIRRRWQLFRWQSWVTLQFRFFEFSGPCRLVVVGSRGVRVERLTEQTGQKVAARRTNQEATIGFTPNLDYKPVRAETFWGYYRGMNPLFDDLFAGQGLFVLQETAGGEGGAKAGRFWSALWNGVLKVFGL